MENSFNKKAEQPLESKKSLDQEPINYDELRGKREQIYKNRDVYKSMTEFVKKLQVKYPDYQNYKIYHFLIGSSLPEEGNFKDEDFPGEDSIVNFLTEKFNG